MTDGDGFFDHAYDISTSEETLEHYARFAEVYDEEVTREGYVQPARTVEMLRRFEPPADASILDVGCGTGLSGVALRDAGFTEVYGCDYSRETLALAEPRGLYGRLFWADLNAPPIEVDDGAYDIATAVGIFAAGHLEVEAMDEILRCVTPGGIFVAAMNEMYFMNADVPSKLIDLETSGTVTDVVAEEGEHIPGVGVGGWVVAMRKSG